jgi:hypothetical protein
MSPKGEDRFSGLQRSRRPGPQGNAHIILTREIPNLIQGFDDLVFLDECAHPVIEQSKHRLSRNEEFQSSRSELISTRWKTLTLAGGNGERLMRASLTPAKAA